MHFPRIHIQIKQLCDGEIVKARLRHHLQRGARRLVFAVLVMPDICGVFDVETYVGVGRAANASRGTIPGNIAVAVLTGGSYAKSRKHYH